MTVLPIDPEHLPAVIDMLRADGVVYLNVKWRPHTPNINLNDGSFRTTRHEPPEWRDLADATCETCLGDGEWPIVLDDGSWGKETCPDCRGTGKPIHTLTVECDCTWTEHEAHYRVCSCLDDSSSCCARSVSVDVVVAELVPNTDTVPWPEDEPNPVIVTHDGRSYIMRFGTGRRAELITPSGPPLQPGNWVAVLRKVDQ